MRAYVITGDVAEDIEVQPDIVGVTSSRKTAIDACEEFLGRIGDQNIINWERKDKHIGYATLGDYTVTYKMFFVNNVEVE